MVCVPMADLLSLGVAACERSGPATLDGTTRSQLRSTGSALNPSRDSLCSACHHDEDPGSSEGLDRDGRALPSANEWQLPLPPVRFPLREALLSLQDGHDRFDGADGQEAGILAQKGPLKVHHTEKSRGMRQLGHMRRSGRLTASTSVLEERPQPIPKAPPEADRPKTPPKANPSMGTHMRRNMRKSAEQTALASWPILPDKSQPAPSLASSTPEIRDTWSSAARAVLGHSKRFPGSHSHLEVQSPTMGSTWNGSTLQSYKNLPRPVKEWADTGMNFTDKGMGVGDRFDLEIVMRARRSPGTASAYELQPYGNTALWSSESSHPTKQVCSQHYSAEVHRMGARWRDNKTVDRQQPCPGSYETLGFVEENQRKIARRGGGRASRASPTGGGEPGGDRSPKLGSSAK